MQVSRPLNPIEFQQELERRAAEEKEKMDQFKAHEEKMKAFQQAKRNGGKPPLALGTHAKENVESVERSAGTNSVNKVANRKNNSSVQTNPQGIKRRNSNMKHQPERASAGHASSKSTNANTNGERNADSDVEEDNGAPVLRSNQPFDITKESAARGAKPESN